MFRVVLTFAGAALATFALAPAAHGASLAVSGGTLNYTAGPDATSFVTFEQDRADVVVTRFSSDSDAIEPGPGCRDVTPAPSPLEPESDPTYRCSGASALVGTAGDRDDALFAFGLTSIRATLDGGTGSDSLEGGEAADLLTGAGDDDNLFGGDGDDRLEGGPGDDVAFQGRGADSFSGGPGVDRISYDSEGCEGEQCTANGVTVTLDGQANDGTSGERDNVGADVEDVEIFSFFFDSDAQRRTAATLIGSDAINSLVGGGGGDTLDGGAGNDILSGVDGDDTLRARDGFADRVTCGAGADTAVVDTLDTVSDSCETVQRSDVGNANAGPAAGGGDRPPAPAEDLAPEVTFSAPAPDAQVPTSGTTTLAAAATDDRGIREVVFLDDGRVVGTDTTAPYSVPYRPQGDDVGRNTLVVRAVDTAGQTATDIRPVRLDRFVPRNFSARIFPARDVRAPFRFRTVGRVTLPEGVTPAQGCGEGVVSVQVKAGSKTISTRRAALARDCSFATAVSFRDRTRFTRSGRLRFTLRFTGNDVLTRSLAVARGLRTR